MTNGETFALTAAEDAVFGVSVKRGMLRLGPSRVALLQAVFCIVIGFIVSGRILLSASSPNLRFNGIVVTDPVPVRILGVVLIGDVLWNAWVISRANVLADANGLQLRKGRHRVNVPWAEIHAIDVFDKPDDESTPAVGPGGFTRQPIGSKTVGFVQTRAGQAIAIPGVSSPSNERVPKFNVLTDAEHKISALRRYAEVTTNRECARVTAPKELEQIRSTLVVAVAITALEFTGFYLLTSWAARSWINPTFLVIGFVFYCGQLAWNRRNRHHQRRTRW